MSEWQPIEIDKLAMLGARFQGIDLKFRKEGTDWPNPWRAECFSAKHEEARFICYGKSPHNAIDNLISEVSARMGDYCIVNQTTTTGTKQGSD